MLYLKLTVLKFTLLLVFFFFWVGKQCNLTAISQLVHHGMIFVPIGYTFGVGMLDMEKVRSGSPYGAKTYVGDGSKQPSVLESGNIFC